MDITIYWVLSIGPPKQNETHDFHVLRIFFLCFVLILFVFQFFFLVFWLSFYFIIPFVLVFHFTLFRFQSGSAM